VELLARAYLGNTLHLLGARRGPGARPRLLGRARVERVERARRGAQAR
jgi:hypothetical protein